MTKRQAKKSKVGPRQKNRETVTTPQAVVTNNGVQPTPEPTVPTEKVTPAAPTTPKKEAWDKSVPYAKDVKEKGLAVPLEGPGGTFTVSFNPTQDAPKDQRWLVTHAGSVVVTHSQYWPAVLDARRRSLAKGQQAGS
jgi:hypothetical protein